MTLADPAFDALPGARAEFGRLGGAAYQIEMPETVAGPGAVPGCAAGADVSFRVDGRRAAQTATNEVGAPRSSLDLTT